MPRSKNWLVYPRAFHEFLHQAVVKRVEIPCGNEREAMKLRGQLYGFFGALQKVLHEKDCPEEVRTLRNLSTQVRLVLEQNPAGVWLVVSYPSDESPMAVLVKNALANQPDASAIEPGPYAPSDAMLELLKKEEQNE